MVNAHHIIAAVSEYSELFPEDRAELADLLRIVSTSTDPTSRREFLGHVTCSGVVLSPFETIVMIEHKFLKRWLLPGGHVEEADASLRLAARREVEEEVGLGGPSLKDLILASPECPLEINRHTIPANSAKNEPEHEHWDFRFTFQTDMVPARRAVDEISGARAMPLEALSEKLSGRVRCLIAGQPSWRR